MQDYGRELTAKLAERLQALRRERGWSVETLAERAGMHRTSVGLIMRGERGMTVASAAAIARALDRSLSEVVAEAEQARPGAEG